MGAGFGWLPLYMKEKREIQHISKSTQEAEKKKKREQKPKANVSHTPKNEQTDS